MTGLGYRPVPLAIGNYLRNHPVMGEPRTVAEVGQILRRRREALHLTQDDFEGVSSSTIRKAENGMVLPGQGLKRSAYAQGLRWPQDAIELLLEGADPASFDRIDPEPEPDALAALQRELATITPDEAARVAAFLAGLRAQTK